MPTQSPCHSCSLFPPITQGVNSRWPVLTSTHQKTFHCSSGRCLPPRTGLNLHRSPYCGKRRVMGGSQQIPLSSTPPNSGQRNVGVGRVILLSRRCDRWTVGNLRGNPGVAGSVCTFARQSHKCMCQPSDVARHVCGSMCTNECVGTLRSSGGRMPFPHPFSAYN